MENPIYVIGHKNPDPDSICAAIAYSAFKKALGINNVIPARCGNSNDRIDTILDHFNLPLPLFIGDVTPRVRDIMVPLDDLKLIHLNSTCSEALEIIDKHDVRALPVVNEFNQIQGMISIFNLGEYFIPKPMQPRKMRFVKTNIESIIRSLKATVINCIRPDVIEEYFIRVGAMTKESFIDYSKKEGTPSQSIIIVGNRREIQETAIDLGVRLLVITSESPVDNDIIEKAKANDVSLVVSPYNVATTAWVIRAAIHVNNLVNKQVTTFDSEEKLSHVRRKITQNIAPIYCVTENDNELVGIFSKSDIIKPIKTNIILVDHNEISQAVSGADEVNILEVIDHHRLGNPPTQYPIRFINEPLGSTCTIIARLFRYNNLKIPKEIAGAMMGGIITDTLNLNSPTTTDVDRQILKFLSDIAEIKADDFAKIIFSSGSIILKSSSDKVIESDSKLYEEGNSKYSVSQVEELGFSNFWSHYDDLIQALETFRAKESLEASFLFITDINSQNSLLAIQAKNNNLLDLIKYPQIEHKPVFELQGIVSRKKQLIPYITSLLEDVPPQ